MFELIPLVIVGLHNTQNDVRASKDIILLKQDETGPLLLELLSPINVKLLKNEMTDKYLDEKIKLNDDAYSKLCATFRGINEKLNRRVLREEIVKLYPTVPDDDTKLLEIFLNCLNKLSNFIKNEETSEMELTTNYIDPILSPLFHEPGDDRQLMWLNRKEETIASSLPDGVIKHYAQKCQGVALGYCEVKPLDAITDNHILYEDLIRLADISKALIHQKKNHVS